MDVAMISMEDQIKVNAKTLTSGQHGRGAGHCGWLSIRQQQERQNDFSSPFRHLCLQCQTMSNLRLDTQTFRRNDRQLVGICDMQALNLSRVVSHQTEINPNHRKGNPLGRIPGPSGWRESVAAEVVLQRCAVGLCSKQAAVN
eukprot:36739-Amphidinium_carterae.1